MIIACENRAVQLPHENVFNLHEFSDEFSLVNSQSVIMHEKNHARTNQFVVSVQVLKFMDTKN